MTSFVVYSSGMLPFLIQFSSQFMSERTRHYIQSKLMLHLALLDCDTPNFVSDPFWYRRSVSIGLFLTLEQFASMSIYIVVYLGSTTGASGCLNSNFAIGELLRGAAEFTLGGQGPLLFAWVQRNHLVHPPTRIR